MKQGARALAAGADALVSLDDDLLSLGRVWGPDRSRSLPVLTPGALLAMLRQGGLLED